MKIISHRGNLKGSSEFENHPKYISDAVSLGLDVEVDIWFINGDFYLGHDSPQYKIEERFIENNKLWCHAKNLAALDKMLYNKNIHCFWHEEDRRTLTSKNIIWTYPDEDICKNSVIVCIDNSWKNRYNDIYGVCTDHCF